MGLRINGGMGIWMAGRAAAQADAILRPRLQESNPGSPAEGPHPDSPTKPPLPGGRLGHQDPEVLQQTGEALLVQRHILVRLRELTAAARDPALVNGQRTAMDAQLGKMIEQLDAISPGLRFNGRLASPRQSAATPSESLGLHAISLETAALAAESLGRVDEALDRVENDRTALRLRAAAGQIPWVAPNDAAASRNPAEDSSAVARSASPVMQALAQDAGRPASLVGPAPAAGPASPSRVFELLGEG